MTRKDRRRFLTGVFAGAVAAPVLATEKQRPRFPKRLPRWRRRRLPDADLADMHAYLQSIPPAKDYKSIPLLNE